MDGIFEIPVTPELRALFAHTHMAMSGSKPSSPQYPLDEQREMIVLCRAWVEGVKNQDDVVKTEDNLLELLHFLNDKGVRVRDILGPIRCYGPRTQGVAMRMIAREDRARKEAQFSPKASSQGLFQEPVLV